MINFLVIVTLLFFGLIANGEFKEQVVTVCKQTKNT
jgi:capsule polysaccharide export protein KpsE/RkpR